MVHTQSPFVITTCAQLQEIQDSTISNYVLGQDLDCSVSATWHYDEESQEYRGFVPIGGGDDFDGVCDGMGYTIYDLYINRPSEYHVGLFNTIEGG